MSIRVLFVETSSTMTIQEIYTRLLSIVVPNMEYVQVLDDTVIKNAIIIRSDLDDRLLLSELSEILPMIGFRGKYQVLKRL
jgi:hypothetical protein